MKRSIPGFSGLFLFLEKSYKTGSKSSEKGYGKYCIYIEKSYNTIY